jgi:hypothetical protein
MKNLALPGSKASSKNDANICQREAGYQMHRHA